MESTMFGWIVCVHFLILITMLIGVKSCFAEVLIPLKKEFSDSLALLGMLQVEMNYIKMFLSCDYKANDYVFCSCSLHKRAVMFVV